MMSGVNYYIAKKTNEIVEQSNDGCWYEPTDWSDETLRVMMSGEAKSEFRNQKLHEELCIKRGKRSTKE
jgi:hypothetical protein